MPLELDGDVYGRVFGKDSKRGKGETLGMGLPTLLDILLDMNARRIPPRLDVPTD